MQYSIHGIRHKQFIRKIKYTVSNLFEFSFLSARLHNVQNNIFCNTIYFLRLFTWYHNSFYIINSQGKFLVISLAIVAAHAKPSPDAYAEGYGYHPEYQNYYVSPVIAAALPQPAASQHHAQDELGQYEYGFNTGNIAKQELKTADGITRGSYSYVDANGVLQTTNYISDDVFGFRVAATNLPQHVVPAAEAPVAAVAPAAAPVAPVVAAAPVAPVAEVKAAPVETGRKFDN